MDKMKLRKSLVELYAQFKVDCVEFDQSNDGKYSKEDLEGFMYWLENNCVDYEFPH